jgi:hypothetical protein
MTLLVPNTTDMAVQLKAIFGRATEGLIEMAGEGSPGEGLTAKRRFKLDEIDAAVAYGAEQNARGLNQYVGWGLRRPDMKPGEKSKSADIISIPAVAWDFDTLETAKRGLEIAAQIGLSFDMVVQTGALCDHGKKDLRVQTWVVLDEPCTDLGRHMELTVKGVHRLGSDKKIIDARRVMRLAGSIAWARKDGRADEATRICYDMMELR